MFDLVVLAIEAASETSNREGEMSVPPKKSINSKAVLPDGSDSAETDPPLIDTGPDDALKASLAQCENAYNAGTPHALLIALLIVRDEEVIPPKWVLNGAVNILEKALTSKLLSKETGGRTAHPIERYRKDVIHFTRWETVTEIMQAPIDEGAASQPDEPGYKEFEEASKKLLHTPFYGTAKTMKDSYQIVEEELDTPSGSFRFFFMSHPEAAKIGLDSNLLSKK